MIKGRNVGSVITMGKLEDEVKKLLQARINSDNRCDFRTLSVTHFPYCGLIPVDDGHTFLCPYQSETASKIYRQENGQWIEEYKWECKYKRDVY